ncbi:NADH-quinone oxidoreductase subunit J [Xiashengella succiniciproducens]|jgi:NADH-quinone oxidoreductase subunit J|uniref:NADH-quinone oxidoreductase subunit J n=1 Tax=Xiashengella succiniciproducens TaxID=2949635 RepID=A0A9J6ZNV9_9BACT|nr:NADH-quinone oxidoreductase subunit J [Alkaliflexus sp. Ai-910]URW79381.1 NADH-quinone oxidoreductase subunit J [Alkaliflexus sp. Ai-910]
MNLHEIVFIICSAVILVFALMTVLSRRILRSATYLLFVLLATAGAYAWLEYQFMAAIQIALYAGGIMVIIIFSILLTHHIHHKSKSFPLSKILTGFGLALLTAGTSIYVILGHDFKYKEAEKMEVDIETIGNHLISTGRDGYSLPFEVISLLLLAVLIGAIIIAKKDKPLNEQEN